MTDEAMLEFADEFLASAGVSDAIPEAGQCATREELGAWFYQFARAARKARLRPLEK